MRHLAATVLLEYTNGDRDLVKRIMEYTNGDRDLVKRIIGWSNMEMIDRYGHIGNRAIPAFSKMNQRLAGRIKTGLGVTRVSQ